VGVSEPGHDEDKVTYSRDECGITAKELEAISGRRERERKRPSRGGEK
jgi:hypothetical protein